MFCLTNYIFLFPSHKRDTSLGCRTCHEFHFPRQILIVHQQIVTNCVIRMSLPFAVAFVISPNKHINTLHTVDAHIPCAWLPWVTHDFNLIKLLCVTKPPEWVWWRLVRWNSHSIAATRNCSRSLASRPFSQLTTRRCIRKPKVVMFHHTNLVFGKFMYAARRRHGCATRTFCDDIRHCIYIYMNLSVNMTQTLAFYIRRHIPALVLWLLYATIYVYCVDEIHMYGITGMASIVINLHMLRCAG